MRIPQVPGDLYNGIWATSWEPTNVSWPIDWDIYDYSVHGIDVTEHYLIKEGEEGADKPLDPYDYSENYLEDEELLLTMNEQPSRQRMGSSD